MLEPILAAIAALALGLVTNLAWSRLAPKTETWTPARVGVVVIAAVIAYAAVDNLNDSPSPAPETGSTATEPPQPTPSEPESTSKSPSEEPEPPDTEQTPTEEPVMAESLVDLPAVTQDTNDDIDLSAAGSVTAGGATFGQALVYECSTYCNGTSPQVLTVTLGGQFTTFSTQAVVLDSSEGIHRVDVTLDSAKPQSFVVKPGVPTPINLDVTGVARMRVQLYAPGELKSPVQAGVDTTIGENGGGLPGLALGDPLLTP